jgi:16S rRNA (cytidine1402-2'-O)-methyltransferase
MLYLVATPIGNLGDISLRALDTLRAVDLVASEDTRKTGLLLKHFDIKKPQIAFFEHNEKRAGPRILEALQAGQSVALVTNAGTPGISDPGFTLVRDAVEAGVPVTMIPGASAVIMAVVLSGLAAHAFTFRGFSPRKGGPRRRFLAVDQHSPHTLVFYESPYRLIKFLEDALAVYGNRPAAVTNDLTKLFETIHRGTLSELIERLRGGDLRGEYTVVVAGAIAGVGGFGEPFEPGDYADEFADGDPDDEESES